MRLPAPLDRIPPLVWVSVVVALLLFPGLGSFGLWDPPEIRVADAAREIQAGGEDRPPLELWLQSTGFSSFGVSEGAGRFPLALCGLLCVVLTGLLGTQLLGRRAGALSALALGVYPALLFQTRQLPSQILATTACLCAWGGLVVALTNQTKTRLAAAAVAAAGLLIGFFAAGGLIGVVLPVAAVAAAFFPRTLKLDPANTPRLACATAALLLVAWAAWDTANTAGGYVPILGGLVRIAKAPAPFDDTLRQLGFALFPLSGLAAVGLGRLLIRPESDESQRAIVAFAASALPLALLYTWMTSSQDSSPVLVALPAFALATGAQLDELLDRPKAFKPMLAMAAACGAFILARDLFLSGDALIPESLKRGVKLPDDLRLASIRPEVFHLVLGVVVGVSTLLAIGGVPGLPKEIYGRPRVGRLLGAVRAASVWIIIAAGVGYGAVIAHAMMPNLAQHLSSKLVVETFRRLRQPEQGLARYRIADRSADYYAGEEISELTSQGQLIELLRSPERVFVLIGNNELAPIDQATLQKKIPYFVVDDTSSRTLLISNQLGEGETDQNDLREFVSTTAPSPERLLEIDFEGKVSLMGYDLRGVDNPGRGTPRIERGKKITIVFYFRVEKRLPNGYKLFVHFDGPGHRFHGDHEPLGGKLPTRHWTPGSYVTDVHQISVPRMTTPAGNYAVYMGFWKGDERIEVTKGDHDGKNRVKLGRLIVR